MKLKDQFKRFLIYLLILNFGTLFLFPKYALAADLTDISDTMSRLKKGISANHSLKFLTPTGAGDVGDTIQITFPAGFTIGLVDFNDIDLSHGALTGYENEESLANLADATHWGASFAGQVLTLTHPTDGVVGDIALNDFVVVEIGTNAAGGTRQITNHANVGVYSIMIGGTFGDDGGTQVVIIDDDQVAVTATVDPAVTFTIAQNSISLKKTDGFNPDWTGTGYNIGAQNTLAATTNTEHGYIITYSGTTLTSGGEVIDAMAVKGPSALNNEQFGINLRNNTTPNTGADPVGGLGVPAADYNTVDQYKFVPGAVTTLATAPAITETTTYTVSYIANVAQSTAGAGYSTTITYICTALF